MLLLHFVFIILFYFSGGQVRRELCLSFRGKISYDIGKLFMFITKRTGLSGKFHYKKFIECLFSFQIFYKL